MFYKKWGERMTEKRFTYDKPMVAFSKGGIYDTVTDKSYEFTMDTVLDFLNELYEEKEDWKKLYADISATSIKEINEVHEENQQLRLELDTHKHPLWSTREAERKVNELTNLLANETKKNAILLEEINSLQIENMRLKELKE